MSRNTTGNWFGFSATGLNRNIKGRAEAGTQPGNFLFVPVLRLDSLALRRRKEDDVPLQGERRAQAELLP